MAAIAAAALAGAAGCIALLVVLALLFRRQRQRSPQCRFGPAALATPLKAAADADGTGGRRSSIAYLEAGFEFVPLGGDNAAEVSLSAAAAYSREPLGSLVDAKHSLPSPSTSPPPVVDATVEMQPSTRGVLGVILDLGTAGSAGGVYIKRVLPGHAAWLADALQAGDEIISCGGRPLAGCNDAAHVRAAFATANDKALATGTTVTIGIRRDAAATVAAVATAATH